MRATASLTAESVCLARAMEHLRPAEERIVSDPYAQHFLYPPTRALLRAARAVPSAREAVRALMPVDMVSLIVSRHRWIDDQLLAALPAVEQVLILGAGYDSRAWRLAGALDGRPLLEIDHPATAARKARCLARAHLAPPSVATADLATEQLAVVLDRCSLRPATPTFVVWEGVSMYLERSAAHRTLRALAAWAGPGARIAFDVWTPAHGTMRAPEGAGRLALRGLGEPVRLRVADDQIPELLAEGGWRVATSAPIQAFAQRMGARVPGLLSMVLAQPDGPAPTPPRPPCASS